MTIAWNDARERAVAALATVHVGIEPVVLALLAECGAIAPADAGWVVGAGQIGMSAGAFLCWRSPVAAGRTAAIAAVIAAVAAAAALALAASLGPVLLLRLGLGAAMGLLLGRATAAAASHRPHRAIGTIILVQQGLAATVMIALPAIAAQWDARAALASLVLVPVVIGLCLSARTVQAVRRPVAAPAGRGDGLSLPHCAGMVLLLVPTLMVWSYLGLAGARFGLSPHAADAAIGLTALASIPAALVATLYPPRASATMVAGVCGPAILSPMLLPDGSPAAAFVVAMALFNAGSTFGVIRFSAWTLASCGSARDRRLVTVTQCLAMAASGPLAALAIRGDDLAAVAVLSAAGAVVATRAPGRAMAAIAGLARAAARP